MLVMREVHLKFFFFLFFQVWRISNHSVLRKNGNWIAPQLYQQETEKDASEILHLPPKHPKLRIFKVVHAYHYYFK